ncbi:MAG: DUF92 domain-containing protein [Gemmatimonadales bacterium]|nr:DUF92 domain-containing protein [Gemmatimonadales bacterium]
MTLSGALAAWAVGALILFGAGWAGGGVLAAFFVSSSLVSRLSAEPAIPDTTRLDSKGNRRDHAQVLANGGVAALAALVGLRDPTLGLWLVTGTLAAAAADTWATSLGARSRVAPRLFWSGRPVPPGTSGGMTVLGTAGGATGGLLVAASGALAGGLPSLLPAATLIGFAGMVADSALGAVVQGRFYCPACHLPSEWPVHRCATATLHRGGLAWLDNDGVNFAATALAAGLSFAAWAWLCPCS